MKISMREVDFIGEGLNRPESVLTTAKGEIFVSDHACGVFQLGTQKPTLTGIPNGFLPNGVALTREREFLVANLGSSCGGGIWLIDRQYCLHPWLMEVDGIPLTVANFVGFDEAGRTWISMCTHKVPREDAFNAHTPDGFVAVCDSRGPRVVAEGIGFANECRVDPSGLWLYVNETYGRCLSRFAILGGSDWKLGSKEVVHRFSDGDFPDGLSFDSEGGAWVACVVSNRIIRIAQDGDVQIMLEDPDQDTISRVELHFASGGVSRADIDAGGTRSLGNTSSVAFGGSDLRTVYVGCLSGTRLATFRSPFSGAKPAHWHF